MNYDELNLFFKKRKSFTISSILLTILFLGGLAAQSFTYQGDFQIFISVFLVLISIIFNLALGTSGFVISVILNSVQLIIYSYRYVFSQQTNKLVMMSMAIMSMAIIIMFQFFFRKIANTMNIMQDRFEKEQTRRITSETQALIGDTIKRTSLIVRHDEVKEQKEVADVIEMSVSKPIDSMTTLPNRDMVIDHLDYLIDKSLKADRNASGNNNPIYVIYLTVDDNVRFASNLGHRIVDLFIQTMAHKLRESAHPNDLVGRVSRNEFAVITNRLKNDEEVVEYLNSLKPAMTDGPDSHLRSGVVQYPRDGRFPGELVHLAEARMRNPSYEKFTPDHDIIPDNEDAAHPSIFADMSVDELNTVFDKAIQNNEIYMVYQPRFNSSRILTGFEAFARWNSPEYGIINTRDFLTQAEKTGHIYTIGYLSMKSALSKLVEINGIEPSLTMTINLSITEIRNPDIIRKLTDAISESGCNIRNLIIDIPEEGLTSGVQNIRPVLDKFANMGITMALDNFGRGYSSLNNIPLLPIDLVKLDGHFTEDLSEGNAPRLLTQSIIELLNDIDIPVAATGVGSMDQFNTLVEFGCTYFQGKQLCVPLNSRDTLEYACRFYLDK